jgi:phosphoesterase RecJ-like protein
VKGYPQIIDRILEIIREHKTFCIVGHVRPDGDCIGSQLGLALALKNEGKKVTVWNSDAIPQKYKFLNPDGWFEKPRAGEVFDCVIATDCASFERLGRAGECIGARKIFINIDHHVSNTRYADVNWISPREPSCGELIYKLLKVARWPITKPIADLLFTAISTDTGSFQYATRARNCSSTSIPNFVCHPTKKSRGSGSGKKISTAPARRAMTRKA